MAAAAGWEVQGLTRATGTCEGCRQGGGGESRGCMQAEGSIKKTQQF